MYVKRILNIIALLVIPQLATGVSTSDGTENSADNAQETEKKESRKELCDKAQKNLELLKDKSGSRTFKTNQGEIVRYSPDEIKQMIKDNESLAEDNCEDQ